MLILTRRVGQSFFIGTKDIRVVVVRIDSSQARLGIEAPSDISVWREELEGPEPPKELDYLVVSIRGPHERNYRAATHKEAVKIKKNEEDKGRTAIIYGGKK